MTPPSPRPSLDEQLARLAPEARAFLSRYHFDAELLRRLAARLGKETGEDNFVKGALAAPQAGDIARLPEVDTPEYRLLHARGARALAQGKVALLVLAGGMATRMGGVVKALIDAVPGKSFLDMRRA